MDTRIRACLTRDGLASHAALVARGFTPDDLHRLVADGSLVRVRRGWYAEAEHWASLDEYAARPRLRAIAAGLATRNGFVFSHDSAAHLLGLPLLRPRREFVHLTRPGVVGSRHQHGVKHHTAPFLESQVVRVDGWRCLDLARTSLDLAREHGYDAGLCAADAALHLGATRAELRAAEERMRNWPHVRTVRAVVDDARPGAESVGETLMRTLVLELDLAEAPEPQFPVLTPSGVAWCDLRVGNHVFEFDGRVKYLPVTAGGVADRDVAEVVMAEKQRESYVRAEGLGMSRLTWEDVFGSGRGRARRRIAREYAATRARLGDVLPPRLAEQAARIRAGGRRPITRPA